MDCNGDGVNNNNMFSKIKIILFLLCFLVLPSTVFANNTDASEDIFKARVVEVLENREIENDNGSLTIQQKLRLKGLEKKWKNQEIIFDGMEYDVIASVSYKVGDRVLVNYNKDVDGQDMFFVIGFVRHGFLYLLAFLFAVIVILVGRFKGARALLVLIFTFLIILKFIIPNILAGNSPLMISIVGSFFILLISIYVTEGFNRNSTVAIFSILISLLCTGLLSVWFTNLAKLNGFANEDVLYLIEMAGSNINVKGLLLAGIIIGALGVLDDVVVSQVVLVGELKKINARLPKRILYKKAMKVGISHLSSMVNTLFLAYAGATLPLLILFSVKQEPALSFNQIINNEIIATEIVRTLAGSVGLVLAVPLSTLLAVYFVRARNS